MRGQSRKQIFIIIQFVLYATFLTFDLLGRSLTLSTNIKFLLVVLCFLYVVIRSRKNRGKGHSFLSYALFFTIISDMFILLTEYYFYGVLTFIIAQQLYGIRIDAFYDRENERTISLSRVIQLRLLYQIAIAAIVILILLLANVDFDALLAVSIFYFISLCTNVIRSLRLSICNRNRKDIRYFAYGMVLFLLCDINVGLFNLSGFIAVGSSYEIIYSISSILMWTFYAPSQVLISLSGDNY